MKNKMLKLARGEKVLSQAELAERVGVTRQTIGLIEAMKMINEIPAPCDCVIESLVAQDGALVGFGDPLFQIREL